MQEYIFDGLCNRIGYNLRLSTYNELNRSIDGMARDFDREHIKLHVLRTPILDCVFTGINMRWQYYAMVYNECKSECAHHHKSHRKLQKCILCGLYCNHIVQVSYALNGNYTPWCGWCLLQSLNKIHERCIHSIVYFMSAVRSYSFPNDIMHVIVGIYRRLISLTHHVVEHTITY